MWVQISFHAGPNSHQPRWPGSQVHTYAHDTPYAQNVWKLVEINDIFDGMIIMPD